MQHIYVSSPINITINSNSTLIVTTMENTMEQLYATAVAIGASTVA
jgi:hypothetical protein